MHEELDGDNYARAHREYLQRLQERLEHTQAVIERAALAYVMSRRTLDRLDGAPPQLLDEKREEQT